MARIAIITLLSLFALICVALILGSSFRELGLIRNIYLSGPLLGGVGFSIALLCGIRWCRFPLRIIVVYLLFIWSASFLAQHSIDRTIGFWIVWTVVESILIAVLIGTRKVHADKLQKNPNIPLL